MKAISILLAIIALVQATKGKVNKDFWHNQKFLFEIVYRIEDPLMFEEYIKLGKTFSFNQDDYEVRIILLCIYKLTLVNLD